MAQRRIKARYRVSPPRMELVTINKARMDEETKSLVQEPVSEEMETYMVHFPQGHSFRVLGRARLVEMGLHLKPRMIDMDTGDVVDVGGDPYDFSNAEVVPTHLEDDELDQLGSAKAKRTRATEAV